MACVFIVAYEWAIMVMGDESIDRMLWLIGGMAYVVIPASSIITLMGFGSHNQLVVLFLLFCVWCSDTAAYFVGKTIGKRPLAPSISPNKTIEGFVGALLGGASIGFISSVFFAGSTLTFTIIGVILAAVAQGGDLFESCIKRRFNVKDSGDLIPGHGGLLDRVDGLFAAAPVLLIIRMIGGNSLF